MGVVVLTMAVTSPLLTLWSTTLLRVGSDPNQFMAQGGTIASQCGPWNLSSSDSISQRSCPNKFTIARTYVLTDASGQSTLGKPRIRSWRRSRPNLNLTIARNRLIYPISLT